MTAEEMVESVMWIGDYPRWAAKLLLELAALEAYAAHERLRAAGFLRCSEFHE